MKRSTSLAGLLLGPIFASSLSAAAPPDTVAWDIVEGLTTEIGARPAGSPREQAARDWAVAKLTALGFSNVHVEPFRTRSWARGAESAEIVSPFPQMMTVAALGYSGSTSSKGLVGQVIGFDSLAALQAASSDAIRGKIVFVSHQMGPTQDGSSYGPFGDVRRKGPSIAADKGAVAILIRSVGTDHHRIAHTGYTDWGTGQAPIPAAALSIPDAEQLQRILKRGRPVTMRLVLVSQEVSQAPSGNVVAEIPGRDTLAGVVMVGGHLDSWDQGTGAIDDAAGIAIMAAAAKRVASEGQPLRTIRVVWFGSEEIGGGGDAAYQKHHGMEKHVLVAESDFGADRVWRFDTRTAVENAPIINQMARALDPFGIAYGGNHARGGSDTEAMMLAGVPLVDLRQDGTRYFDVHHTADDTLDKIDPVQLEQNVAAWTAVIRIAANSADSLEPVPSKASNAP